MQELLCAGEQVTAKVSALPCVTLSVLDELAHILLVCLFHFLLLELKSLDLVSCHLKSRLQVRDLLMKRVDADVLVLVLEVLDLPVSYAYLHLFEPSTLLCSLQRVLSLLNVRFELLAHRTMVLGSPLQLRFLLLLVLDVPLEL